MMFGGTCLGLVYDSNIVRCVGVVERVSCSRLVGVVQGS